MAQLRRHPHDAESHPARRQLGKNSRQLEEVVRSVTTSSKLGPRLPPPPTTPLPWPRIHFTHRPRGAALSSRRSATSTRGLPRRREKHGPNALIDETLPSLQLSPTKDPAGTPPPRSQGTRKGPQANHFQGGSTGPGLCARVIGHSPSRAAQARIASGRSHTSPYNPHPPGAPPSRILEVGSPATPRLTTSPFRRGCGYVDQPAT